MHLTLLDAKRQLNIDDSYTGDDEYITELIAVSEDAVQHHLDRSFEELVEERIKEGKEGILPPAVLHAVRFLVGQLYANREPAAFTSAMEVPYTYGYLISLYKRYTAG